MLRRTANSFQSPSRSCPKQCMIDPRSSQRKSDQEFAPTAKWCSSWSPWRLIYHLHERNLNYKSHGVFTVKNQTRNFAYRTETKKFVARLKDPINFRPHITARKAMNSRWQLTGHALKWREANINTMKIIKNNEIVKPRDRHSTTSHLHCQIDHWNVLVGGDDAVWPPEIIQFIFNVSEFMRSVGSDARAIDENLSGKNILFREHV